MSNPILRSKPYFWVSWLCPLLSGEDNCEYKVWLKSHYTSIEKLDSDFDSSKWNENHTALLMALKEEYSKISGKVLMEGETSWKMIGRTADVAGKMDLITLGPNLVIDAKSGKAKDSHIMQMKIYLLAIELGLIPGITGEFVGVLRYPNFSTTVLGGDAEFKDRFFSLVSRLALKNGDAIPSRMECKFCDIARCSARYKEIQGTPHAKVNF